MQGGISDQDEPRAAVSGAVGPRSTHFRDPGLSFVTPQLKKICELWHHKRATRTMPGRSDFTMRDLSFALPNIAVVTIVREPQRTRFQVRLMGSQLDTYVGPMTGKFIDEALPPGIAGKWASIWNDAVENRCAGRAVGQVEVGGKTYYAFEKFSAPLAADGEVPASLLIATYYHARTAGHADQSDVARRLMSELEVKGT